MKTCVFPGSFDPVTKGHMDLIRRAAGLFDRVTVTVMINVNKQGKVPREERVRLLEKACKGLKNVRIDCWDGLLADYMRRTGENCVIRGVRNAAEFETECVNAAANRTLFPGMDTLLFPASEGCACISSSAVREIASFGGDIRPFVPDEVAEDICLLLTNKE